MRLSGVYVCLIHPSSFISYHNQSQRLSLAMLSDLVNVSIWIKLKQTYREVLCEMETVNLYIVLLSKSDEKAANNPASIH